tara:strand:+ start:467 stop:598 length:132 start_codon:yes stop_codon:yes gene_type:complete
VVLVVGEMVRIMLLLPQGQLTLAVVVVVLEAKLQEQEPQAVLV